MLVLYTGDRHFSSWSMRGLLMVTEKGVPFEERNVELDWPLNTGPDGSLIAGDGNTLRESCAGCVCDRTDLTSLDAEGLLPASVAALLPRVPVLADTTTGAVVSDILGMAEYLDEQFPGPALLPPDPARRAAVRSLSAHIHCDLEILLHEAPYATSLRPGPLPPVLAGAAEQAQWIAETLETILSRWGGEYLFGDFTMADAMLAPIAQQFRGWQLSAPRPVADYFARLLTRPSVAHHLEQARQPYELISAANPGSPQWITRHYRYHRASGLLHDWQADICHQIVGPVTRYAVELAYAGGTFDEIGAAVARKFDTGPAEVTTDLQALFATLNPGKRLIGASCDYAIATS